MNRFANWVSYVCVKRFLDWQLSMKTVILIFFFSFWFLICCDLFFTLWTLVSSFTRVWKFGNDVLWNRLIFIHFYEPLIGYFKFGNVFFCFGKCSQITFIILFPHYFFHSLILKCLYSDFGLLGLQDLHRARQKK